MLDFTTPEGFICPISHQIMDDPYIDTDGNSYEHSAIVEWLTTRQISPITRRPLFPESLVPNRVLKTLIDEYKASLLPTTEVQSPVIPESPLSRKPILLVAVIDNSGSMGEACGGNSNEEDDGFSRLDLVKHTMNTIITSLTKFDKLCLIKFSNSAEVIADVTLLTDVNKKILMEKLKHLTPEYSTNIWDGLRSALDIVATQPAEVARDYNMEIFLLTDGVPNINPPRPITETLSTYMNKKFTPELRPKVHTFGYGYSLQSEVLYELARVGQGTFGFIPDSSMVGTVFINSLSNSLVDADPSVADPVVERASESFCVVLRELIATSVFADRQTSLNNFISTIEELVVQNTDSPRALEFLQAVLLDCKDTADANAGQIMKAIQSTFFTKWGKHYLYSVLSAFENRVCINFKDKAMQTFKSEQFKVEQERIEEVFVQLPAPKPYRQQQSSQHHSHSYAAAPPVSMTNYHTQRGGCFTGDSVVLRSVDTEDGVAAAPVKASEVRAGMLVWSKEGPTQVECVVQLRYIGPIYQGR